MPFARKPAQEVETDLRPPIALVRIKSDQLATLGYDAETEIMAAQFRPKEGTTAFVYHYLGVSSEKFAEAGKPETTGSQFRAIIKGVPFKKYAAEQIPELAP